MNPPVYWLSFFASILIWICSSLRYGFFYGFGVTTCLALGGMIYEHIGRDDLATDCAERVLRFHRKPCALIEAHLILARVTQRKGRLIGGEVVSGDAEAHFRTASELAVRYEMPLYCLIAGKHCGGVLRKELIEVGLRAFEAVDGGLQRAMTEDMFPFLN